MRESCQVNKSLVVSDDEILIDFIDKVLPLYDECLTEYVSLDEIHDMSILKGVKYILIDERKDVQKLLKLNLEIKRLFPNSILMIVTGYAEGEFDNQFIKSGIDYVIPVNKLSEKLSEICETGLL